MSEVTISPPGTTLLFEYDRTRNAEGEIVLLPTPSEDINDPLNWPKWRKTLNYLLITAVTLAQFTLLSTQTTFWTQMSIDMNVDYADLTNAQAVQLVGLSVGCIFVIPFTKKYGRRSTYIFSTAVLAGACWWAAYMKTDAELFVTSLLFGLAGAPNETVVQMTIIDMFFLHERATANSVYGIAIMMGSFLTPMIAGYQASITGWRSSYFSLALTLTALTVLFIPLLEETKYIPVIEACAMNNNPPAGLPQSDATKDIKDGEAHDGVILEAARISSRPGMVGAPPRPKSWRQRMRLFTPSEEPLLRTAYHPLYTICLPHVVFTAVQFASAVCWLVVMSSMISIVFAAPPYNFNSAALGYMFAGPFVGSIFGSVYGGPFLDWATVQFAKRNNGVFEPEMRLYLFPFQALVMAGGLVMFGVTADKGWHWIYPSIGCALFGFGLSASGDICFTLVLDTYPQLVSEAFVLITLIRNSISIAGPFSISPWLATMSVSYMFITAGLITLGLAFFCIPMFIWGKKWRMKQAMFYYQMSEKLNTDRRW